MLKKETEKYLNDFAKYVITKSKFNLKAKGKSNTGKLESSLGKELEISANSFRLAFLMEDYGNYQDKGVKGKSSSIKAPDSPYKFGTGTGAKGGLTQGIDKWVSEKRIQFKDRKSGRFLSYKSTAFLIRNSIWHKGIKPSLFFTRPFEEAFKRMPDELVEAYGLDVEQFLQYTINK